MGMSRLCAYCLEPADIAVVCEGCKRRAYCSAQCRENDKENKVGSQCHKQFCPLNCGEEGVTWEVKEAGAGKGLGVFALVDIPKAARIMVDANRPRDHPKVMDLMGKNLADKIRINTLGTDTHASVIALRLCRVNHACDENSAHFYDSELDVKILSATRDIKAGEEILISYVSTNDPSKCKSAEEVRQILKIQYNIICPTSCRCHDTNHFEILKKAAILDQLIPETGMIPTRGVALAEKLLGLLEKLGAYDYTVARTSYDIYQLALSFDKTKATKYLRVVRETYAKIYRLNSSWVRKYDILLDELKSRRGAPQLRKLGIF